MKRYVTATRGYPAFRGVDVAWSDGTGDDFPRLRVRARPEIVTFGVPDEVRVGPDGVIGGGARLTPTQLHALMAERGDDVVLFDGRNRIEAEVGHFSGAVTTDARTTRDFVPMLDSGMFDHLKNRPIVTYCTGGIRCEVLSALMHARGFSDVYQLDGGIARYGKEFGDSGLWDGSLYVFDNRMTIRFSDAATTIGRCADCGGATDSVANHPDPAERDLRVICDACSSMDGAVSR